VADIWMTAVLLLVMFVLLVFGRIAKAQRTRTVFLFLALAAWGAAWWSLSLDKRYAYSALIGPLILFSAIFDLIGIYVWRRRVLTPCVTAKRYSSAAAKVITSVCFIGLAISVFFPYRDSLDMLLAGAPLAVAMIIYAVLFLFDTIVLCANGILEGSNLWAWDEFEYFAWERKMGDKVELRLLKRESDVWQQLRLLVPPEDRDATQKILAAHLVDITPVEVGA
jgi:hypothetical protein